MRIPLRRTVDGLDGPPLTALKELALSHGTAKQCMAGTVVLSNTKLYGNVGSSAIKALFCCLPQKSSISRSLASLPKR